MKAKITVQTRILKSGESLFVVKKPGFQHDLLLKRSELEELLHELETSRDADDERRTS